MTYLDTFKDRHEATTTNFTINLWALWQRRKARKEAERKAKLAAHHSAFREAMRLRAKRRNPEHWIET